MSNPQIQIQPNPTETNLIGTAEDFHVQVTGDNVIQFPVPVIPNDIEPVSVEQGEIADQADPVNGISRDEVAAALEHEQYQQSKASIEQSIQETKEATENEALRQARFLSSDNRDEIATRKSEQAFDDVDNLVKPAGTTKAIGQKILKIVDL